MQKEIRLKCSNEVADAAELGADRLGLTTSAYTRMALIKQLIRDGIHPEQPKAD
jgi:antitoxin component of RelBE/YafQ-DinJ toxin-antitoxin module